MEMKLCQINSFGVDILRKEGKINSDDENFIDEHDEIEDSLSDGDYECNSNEQDSADDSEEEQSLDAQSDDDEDDNNEDAVEQDSTDDKNIQNEAEEINVSEEEEEYEPLVEPEDDQVSQNSQVKTEAKEKNDGASRVQSQCELISPFVLVSSIQSFVRMLVY